MKYKPEIVIDSICNYRYNRNIFKVLPIEELKLRYLMNKAELLPTILEAFNLKISDTSIKNDLRSIYHGSTTLSYDTGKLQIGLGIQPFSDIPHDIQELIRVPQKSSNIENELRNFLHRYNIRPWLEVEKTIKGSKNWLGIDESLRIALLMDFIFELIASSKNKKLFGEISTLNLLSFLKTTVSDINFIPKSSQYNLYLDALKFDDPYTYYYNIKKSKNTKGIKINSIDITDNNLMLSKAENTAISKTAVILHYYYQLIEPRLNPKHKLHSYYASIFQYTMRSKANKSGQKMINNEYSLLYQQLPYIYMARWLTEVELTGSKHIPSFSGIEILNDNNAAKVTIELKDLNLTKDISSILNYPCIYKQHGKTFSLERKFIYQSYYFAYLTNSIANFGNSLKSYYNDMQRMKNSTNENITKTFLEIFRFGYLLRNSIIFKFIHSELLSKLGFDINDVSRIAPAISTPSYFSTTFLYLLTQQHLPTCNIQLLKKESDKYNSLVAETSNELLEENKEVILSTLNKTLFEIYSTDYYKPKYATTLTNEIQKYLASIPSKELETEKWKNFNKTLTDYYEKKQPPQP